MQSHRPADLLDHGHDVSLARAPTTTTRGEGARTTQAAILSACMLLILGGIGFLLGRDAFLLCALTMPVPLVLLWSSADVKRADEK